ncbi:MAG: hypothetical protein CBC35_08830 [Planctomycetes bacterium TMED75]|nr:aldo/keto reductase [Planctomycetaceae bacterium]OUU91780.1 MAG: hypothetical protein CBC35_08830 [Planctomycetes bacterium TMED75]
MDLRPLGTTGLKVSPVGFGAFKIGRNQKTKYAQPYDLPDQEAVDRLLHALLDSGITLFDTAPAYGTSEERIGTFLRHSGLREQLVLCTKVGERFEAGASSWAFDRSSVDASIDRSLRTLGVSHLDVVNVHSDGRDLEIIHQTDVLDALARRRDQGDIRTIGFSGKTVEGHLEAMEHPAQPEVLMIELNLEDQTQLPTLEAAAARGVGLLIKKGLASGRAGPRESLQWLLAHEAISSVVIGSTSARHMRANSAVAHPTD